MGKKLLAVLLSLATVLSFSLMPQISAGTGSVSAGAGIIQQPSEQAGGSAKSAINSDETEVATPKLLDIGNHVTNGSFGIGTDGFATGSTTTTYSTITGADGNVYASVLFDAGYSKFFSDQTSLKANTTYTFSFDYYITSDNPNQYAYGLSTVNGHPSAGQQITPSGTAPYTVTNLSTSTVVRSSSGNTSLIMYGSGTRTLAVDGVNRTASADYGAWMRYSTTFTLSSDAPSVYFYFMSYEQGKQADGVTPLTYNTTKKICFDNITIKGLYDVSVSAGTGGKATMQILDSSGYSGKVYENGRVLYTATPAYQNEFAGWVDDSSNVVSTDVSYTARPSTNTHLTATFTADNGVRTYGAEYSMTDETIDASTTATTASVSNTSGITSLGSNHVKIYGSSTYRYFRYNQMTLQPNTNYTLSFYMYYTGTNCHFALMRDTGFSADCGDVIQRANWNTTASLNLAEVTPSGETSMSTTTLHSSDNYMDNTNTAAGKWVHYTMTFNSGSFAAADNILTASGPATQQNPNTATSYYTSDYTGSAYFALRYDGVPSLSGYILLDNVSLTKSSSITITPATGGTVSCSQFGGTVSSSTTKTLLNGTYATVTATPTAGKGFVAWVDENSSPVSYNKSYSFFVNKNQTLKPLFDNGNKVYNGDYASGTTGWTVYGEAASNPGISALDTSGLQTDNVPATPTGHSALKLSFNRTDGAMNKRVQAYSGYTFATENNKTYEVSVWCYSKYINPRITIYVPTTQTPQYQDATNDFCYVGSGYNVGATQLAGSIKTYLNDSLQTSTSTYAAIRNYNRSFDVSGDKNGWTKMSFVFTTDSNSNCVRNASIALDAMTCSSGGINYTSGSVYFTDVSVKTYDTYTVTNNKLAGNATANGKVVLSSTSGTAVYGTPLTLKAEPYDGFLFTGWYKDSSQTAFSQNAQLTIFQTGAASYEAKYSYNTTVPNLFLSDFENLSSGTDIEDTGSNALGAWKLLAASDGSYVSWGAYNASNGTSYSVTPHGGGMMLADFGRYNITYRTMTVTPNTSYLLSFYYYQKTATSNALEYAAITTSGNSNVKTGSNSERSLYSSDFLAYNYTSINANSTWRKYTLSFNSGNNSTLKFFMKYNSPYTDSTGYLFLDDFSLLPVNTVDSSGATALSVSNNTTALSSTFKGISSTVYHGYTYMDDAYGRNYTDEMATYEFDRLKNSGIKTVRTAFKSQWAWSDSLGTWDWNSQRMNDFYAWATEMQNRGINIALNAGWHLQYLISGSSSIPEVPYLYANGDYSLACARYGAWITAALQAFESRGIHNVKYLICFTEPSPPTPTPLGTQAAQWVQACNALSTALTSAGIRGNYKIVGPNQGSTNTGEGLLNYALDPLQGNADSSIDIYSTHYYPSSTSITDDVYGSLCNSTFTSYMNVMARYNNTKDFWADEFFAKANNAALGTDNAWSGTQTCVGMTSAMNCGIDSVLSWQELDQLWVDQNNTGGEFVNGIHTCGTAPSLFVSAVPRSQYYALTLMSKYLGYQNGLTYTSTAPADSGLYISTARLEDGSWTVMVVNASSTTKKIQATFATAINQTLYRHLYDPATIQPDARAKVIGADKVYNNVGTSLCDNIPSGGVAIYTGLDF